MYEQHTNLPAVGLSHKFTGPDQYLQLQSASDLVSASDQKRNFAEGTSSSGMKSSSQAGHYFSSAHR